MHRPVSDDVLQRVSAAVDELAAADDMPRTKRSVETLSGLSHDAVARAFRQDRDHGTPHRLSERFDALTDGDRRSPLRRELGELQQRYAERGREIDALEAELSALAQVVLATSEGFVDDTNVVPIRRPQS